MVQTRLLVAEAAVVSNCAVPQTVGLLHACRVNTGHQIGSRRQGRVGKPMYTSSGRGDSVTLQ